MQKLKNIVVVDETKMASEALRKLEKYGEEVKVYHDYPSSEEEILKRIKDAEGVVVSWKTKITSQIINQCKNLKYIGMACSLYDDASANVAVKAAREKGITVTGIFDYGDPGVTEFVISELIQLLHGFGKHQWKDMPAELAGQKVGIIGLGTTGKLVAKALLGLGVEVFYFSRTRKKEWESQITYLPLHELLKRCEIVSLHLPKNTVLLKEEEFNCFGKGKILINTSLGIPFDERALQNWLNNHDNFAILDGDASAFVSEEIKKLSNLLSLTKSAGWSAETQKRLGLKVLENLEDFLIGN